MRERNADPLDDASELANSIPESAIAAARKANEPQTHPDFDGESCIDCGETIPAERLANGRIRCVRCQSKLEKREKQIGKGTPFDYSYA